MINPVMDATQSVKHDVKVVKKTTCNVLPSLNTRCRYKPGYQAHFLLVVE